MKKILMVVAGLLVVLPLLCIVGWQLTKNAYNDNEDAEALEAARQMYPSPVAGVRSEIRILHRSYMRDLGTFRYLFQLNGIETTTGKTVSRRCVLMEKVGSTLEIPKLWGDKLTVDCSEEPGTDEIKRLWEGG